MSEIQIPEALLPDGQPQLLLGDAIEETRSKSSGDKVTKYCKKSLTYWILVTLSSLGLVLGGTIAPILGRLYYVKGGNLRWLITWTLTAGWPINIPPLVISYKLNKNAKSLLQSQFNFRIFLACILLGLLMAFDNLLYSWGISYIPLSTSSILLSTQLIFNAIFSYFIIHQKITPCVFNSIIVVTFGSILLGVNSHSDLPQKTNHAHYVIGFGATIAAATLYGLLLPLTEFVYQLHGLANKERFMIVLEVQTYMCISASVFCLVGMWINGDFYTIHKEAMENFDMGITSYIMVITWSAILCQVALLGLNGIIFLVSSLAACIYITTTLPLSSILSAIIFRENFDSLKVISMLLSIWGFVSYIYSEYFI